VPLGDGDALALHDDGPPEGRAAVVLIHGLSGCHQSGYMVRCSAKLRARGVRVFRMDLRGCGAGFAWARHPLHAGRSEDAAAVLEFVSQLCPGLPVHLIGFSMGGNLVLKLAGELAGDAPPHLASVMAVSPPIDLVACCTAMQQGFNRVYDRRFVRGLVADIARRINEVPGAVVKPLVPLPRRLLEFDSVFTAPAAGFADVDDYYCRASSGRVLERIAVPALIVTAASDPIVPLRPFEVARYSPTTHVVIAPCGGHLGFVAAGGIDPDRRWLDWRVVEWVLEHASTEQPNHQLAMMPRIGP
jgi:predicted alpha/beta-fold hydrolase